MTRAAIPHVTKDDKARLSVIIRKLEKSDTLKFLHFHYLTPPQSRFCEV
jgi:hypothetical protein